MILPLLAAWAGSALAQGSGAASPQTIRPIGVVTKLQAGSFTLHTDAGPDLLIVLADGVSFLRVPPGATNLQAATKIALSDINTGDRVLVRGRVSEDQKSIVATSMIVMTKSDLAGAREAERLDECRIVTLCSGFSEIQRGQAEHLRANQGGRPDACARHEE